MKQCDKDLLYRKVKVISEGRDTWYAVVNHNTFFAQEAAAGRHHPSLAFVLNVSNVRLKWLQTPSRPLKMVHRAARSCRVITPATTTSRPMTPTMNPRVGAGWGVVTTTDVPHRHADSRAHCRRVTRGRRAEKTRPNPAENSTCAPNTISTPDFRCAWPGLRAAGRDFFFVSRRNLYLLAKTRRGLYRMLKSIQKPCLSQNGLFLTLDPRDSARVATHGRINRR